MTATREVLSHQPRKICPRYLGSFVPAPRKICPTRTSFSYVFLVYVFLKGLTYMGAPDEVGRLSNASRKRHAKKETARHRRFIWGPLPLRWFSRASRLASKACNVALAIWYKRGLMKSKEDLPITPKVLGEFDVSSKTGRRVLQLFDENGLIELKRQSGKSPRVTILDDKEGET